MGQALYRKYRSRSLDELIGQDHVVQTLKNGLKSGKISHAYLFTGPRGVGKTSVARILAHEVNDIPYSDEDTQLDIIEIDAASNRGIDEIRDLRERAYISPTSGKFKVYIIDEVHMLTSQAFNALLKTLEEPPAHVIFILATTEVHKLPDTIISRTQKYTFKPVDIDSVSAHLKDLASREKIKISDEAIYMIAEHGEGSFRDSIGLLDQASGLAKKIEQSDIEALLGLPNSTLISALFQALVENDQAGLLSSLERTRLSGSRAGIVAKSLGQMLRGDTLSKEPRLDISRSITLQESLLEVPASRNPYQLLELELLRFVLSSQPPADNSPAVPTSLPTQKTKLTEVSRSSIVKKDATRGLVKPKQIAHQKGGPSQDIWKEVLAKLKTSHNTLYGVLHSAGFSAEGNEITLVFNHNFHRKIAESAKNKSILTELFESVAGIVPHIYFVSETEVTHVDTSDPVDAVKNTPKSSLDSISNIFGGAELLES